MQTIKRTWSEFSEDNLTDAAAALTYYAILSIFPGAVGDGLNRGIGRRSAHGHQGADRPGHLDRTRVRRSDVQGADRGSDQEQRHRGHPADRGISRRRCGRASGYVGAFMRASNVIYEVEEGRSMIKLRPLQMLVTLVLVVLLALVLVALVLTGPLASKVGSAIGIGSTARDGVEHREVAGLADRRDVHDRAAVLRVA